MNRSSDITYENITMFCAGASYVGVRNKNISILGCRTVRKDDRLASSTADGILLQAGENGPWVENCVFEEISDDGMNVYQHPLWVKQIRGQDHSRPEREKWRQCRPDGQGRGGGRRS